MYYHYSNISMLFDKNPKEDTPRMLFGKQRSEETALYKATPLSHPPV